MDALTLGQISGAITLVVGIITGIAYLSQNTKKWIKASMKEQMDSIDTKLDSLNDRLDQVDMESCKNYLVTFLSKVEKGVYIDEIEKERFWEQYQHYQKLGGNSYIKRKIDDLAAKNII